MELKRHYEKDADGKPVRVSHVSVVHTGTTPQQNFSGRLVDAGLADGWLAISGTRLTIKTDGEPLGYTIVHPPGVYCCHDGKPIALSQRARDERLRDPTHAKLAASEARAYLEKHGFAGKASPDPQNPSGYRVADHYECVLDADQHAQFNVQAMKAKANEGPTSVHKQPARKGA
jgi:hypothetical protein